MGFKACRTESSAVSDSGVGVSILWLILARILWIYIVSLMAYLWCAAIGKPLRHPYLPGQDSLATGPLFSQKYYRDAWTCIHGQFKTAQQYTTEHSKISSVICTFQGSCSWSSASLYSSCRTGGMIPHNHTHMDQISNIPSRQLWLSHEKTWFPARITT